MASSLLDNSVFAERLRRIVDRCGGNIPRRRAEVSQVRAEYMVARVAAKLGKLTEFSGRSEAELKAVATRILAKAGARSISAPGAEKRTDDEEKLISSAKVTWHRLLKAEGLAPARPWSRTLAREPKRRSARREIPKEKHNSDEAKQTFQRYVARQALHLLNACEEVRSLDEAAVSPRIEQIVAALYAACVSADPVLSIKPDEE